MQSLYVQPAFAQQFIGPTKPAADAVAASSSLPLATVAASPEEYPPWLEDLRDRFTVVANGLKLLKDVTDLDKIVGNDPDGNNPWTLRSDTEAAKAFLPEKVRLRISQFLNRNIGKIMSTEHSSTSNNMDTNPVQNYNNQNMSAEFALSEQMVDQLANALLNEITKAFTPEQLIDFVFYILAHTPLFPKRDDPHAWEYWQKVKQKIIYYQVYVIIAAAIGALMFDQVQLQVSGYIFKFKGDAIRVGWYGGLKHFGANLKGAEFKAGLKARTATLEATGGVVKRMSPNERLALETRIVSRILSRIIEPEGWNSEASASITHFLSDEVNPANQGETAFAVGAVLKKDLGNTTFSIQNSASITTNGRPGLGVTTIVGNRKHAVEASASLNAGMANDIHGRNTYRVEAGFFGSYQWEGGAKGLKKALASDAEAVRTAMYQIESLQRQEQTKFVISNFASYRFSLKKTLNAYFAGMKHMMDMHPPEERYYLLSDREIGLALIQAEKADGDIEANPDTKKLMERFYFRN